MSLCKCQQPLLLKIQKSFSCCVTERKNTSVFVAGAEMHLTTNVLCGSFVCEKAGLGWHHLLRVVPLFAYLNLL